MGASNKLPGVSCGKIYPRNKTPVNGKRVSQTTQYTYLEITPVAQAQWVV
jgi:hypothetical protein